MAALRGFKLFGSLAVLRLREAELRELHHAISELSPGAFVELIRDIEDEIDSSVALFAGSGIDRQSSSRRSEGLYRELDALRKKLRMTVHDFAENIEKNILDLNGRASEFPRFVPRRGLQSWIARLVERYSEEEVYHAAMRMLHERSGAPNSEWKLR
jgi:hypothetical protein